MSGAMLHGAGDCTPENNCGCYKPAKPVTPDPAQVATELVGPCYRGRRFSEDVCERHGNGDEPWPCTHMADAVGGSLRAGSGDHCPGSEHSSMKLPKILIHPRNGDASLLIDGYKMPPGTAISGEYDIDASESGWLQVNITLFASEVTVIDGERTAAHVARATEAT